MVLEMNKNTKNKSDDSPFNDIRLIELYLMFYTDCDFRVDVDGLKTFINSRLGLNSWSLDNDLWFNVEDVPFKNGGYLQLIRLQLCRFSQKEQHGHFWITDAIEQIFFPAYMWIFAEMGVGNHHGLCSYYDARPFDLMDDVKVHEWKKSDFDNGDFIMPRVSIMSGNYGDSWAQWRFSIPTDNCPDWGTKEFTTTKIIKEIEESEE